MGNLLVPGGCVSDMLAPGGCVGNLLVPGWCVCEHIVSVPVFLLFKY